MSRTAEINLTIDLDDDDIPTRIVWEASESSNVGPMHSQSMMLSLWDAEQKTIAAIDLWEKDTTIDDMNHYFYQAIHQMANTYLRATKNESVSKLIHKFGESFGSTVGLVSNGSDKESARGAGLDLISLAEDNRERGV